MIQDKIFFDEKDPTGLSYNTPFTYYGSYQGRLWSKSPSGSIQYYTQNSDLSAYATTGSNQFSGSQTVTGSLTVTGTITGTVAGTTATASYVEYTNVANKPTLVSGSSQVTYSGLTGIPSGIVSGSAQIASFGIFATTGSNGFNGSQSITGSLTVTGQVVAQTLNVQQVTSSIVYSSGSNIFGNSLSNTQQFTGSVSVTGSLTVNTSGVELQVTNTGVNLGNALTDSHIISGSLRVNPNGLFVSGSGNVGVGTTSPLSKFHVNTGTNQNFRVRPGTDVGATNGVALNSRTDDDGSLQQLTLRASDVVMLTSGNVGIGTASPESLSNNTTLQIDGTNHSFVRTGTSNYGGYFATIPTADVLCIANVRNPVTGTYSNTGKAASGINLFSESSNGYITFLTTPTNNSGPSERMRITSGGNVGIGITPSYKLDIANSVAAPSSLEPITLRLFNGSDGGSAIYFQNVVGGQSKISFGVESAGSGTDDTYLGFSTGANTALSERMRITSGGNVGIGTDNPQSSLHIYSTNATAIIQNSSTSSVGNLSRLFYRALLGSGAIGFVGFIDGVLDSTTQNTGYLKFHTYNNGNADERMRITSGGNMLLQTDRLIGLNTSDGSDTGYLAIAGAGGDGANRAGHIYLSGNERTVDAGNIVIAAGNISSGTGAPGTIVFRTGDSAERMRITSGGALQMSNNSTTFSIGSIAGVQRVQFGTGGFTTEFQFLGTNDGYAPIGASAFNTRSDYRLKEDLKEFSGLSLVTDMKVYDFKWKEQNERNYGFMAHELQEIVPYVVTGTKDGMFEDKPQMQGLDHSKLVPVLVKAIQELSAKIETLEAEIQTLKQQ